MGWIIILFSVTPKSRRKELFDYDKEVDELTKSIEKNPLTLIVGPRRTGKTSLLRVALNECGLPYLYIDPRFSMTPDYRDFTYLLKHSLEDFLNRHRALYEKILNTLKGVKGLAIEVPSLTVEISWSKSNRLELNELFSALNDLGESMDKPIVIAIDEAQELRRVTWISFERILAYIYDNLKNLRLVLTGSEIGLIYRFLRLDDPSSYLYGRYIHIIKTRRLTREESLLFLKTGLQELGLRFPEDKLINVVEVLDGVIGWLAYFGYMCYNNVNKCWEDIDSVVNVAVETAKQEIVNFINARKSPRYKYLFKILVVERTWSEIKRMLESLEGKTINDRTLYELLQELLDMGLVDKINNKYILSDPLIRRAAERL